MKSVQLLLIPLAVMLGGWFQPIENAPLSDDEPLREHCAITGLLDVENASSLKLEIKCLQVFERGMRVRRAEPKELKPNDKGEFWTPFDVRSYFTLDKSEEPTLHYEVERKLQTHRLPQEDGHYSFKDVIDKLGNDNQ